MKGESRPSLSGAGRELTAEQEAKVWAAIEGAVEQSCIKRPMPISGEMTEKEIGDRVDVCCTIFRDLYFEARWSRQRICDHLEMFLIHCIDGAKEWKDAPVYDAKGAPAATTSVMYGKQALREIEGERRLSALAAPGARDTVEPQGPALIIKGNGTEEG